MQRGSSLKNLAICIALLLSAELAGASENTVSVRYPAALEELQSPTDLAVLTPERLAEKMIKRRETRFIGIAGFVVEVPGVQTDKCDVVRTYVYILPGTSDQGGTMGIELSTQVFRVASSYNQIMKQYLLNRSGTETYMKCYP